MTDPLTILVDHNGVAIETWPAEPQEVYTVQTYQLLHPELQWAPDANSFLPRPAPPEGFLAVAGRIQVFSQGAWKTAFDSFRSDLESVSFTQEILTRAKEEPLNPIPKAEEYGRQVILTLKYPPRDI